MFDYIQEAKIEITILLDKNELFQALSKLNMLVGQASDWHFHDRIHEINTAYQLLINAYIYNQEDDERALHYTQIRESMYVLLDQLIDKLNLDKDHHSIYWKKKHLLSTRISSYIPLLRAYQEAIETGEAHLAQECLSYFFDCVWTRAIPSERQQGELLKALFDAQIPTTHQATFVTAILLSLIEHFDRVYCQFLIKLCSNTHEIVSLRAYVALCFTLVTWPQRIANHPDLQAQIEELCQQPAAMRTIRTIQTLLIYCKETLQVVTQMQEEILPDMIQVKRKLSHEADDVKKENHPEWMDYMEDESFTKNMQHINEMQSEGSDVMMGAFASLKNYPFFQTVMHWFLPFDMQFLQKQEELDGIAQHYPQIIQFVKLSRQLCNSDKYSFVLSLPHLPTDQVESMHAQMDIPQALAEQMARPSESEHELLNQYLRDLYRFYKIHPRKGEFCDIFEQELHLFEVPLLQSCFSHLDDLRAVGDLYMHKNFLRDAVSVWTVLKEKCVADRSVYQKLGFCYQQLHDYDQAIAEYQQAEILQIEDLWTLRKLAQCFKNTHQYEQALHYYLQYDKEKPNQGPILVQIGLCYAAVKQYSSALRFYYKAYFLDANNVKAIQGIAFVSLLCDDWKKSQEMYLILYKREDNPTYNIVRLGHTYWLSGNIQQALVLYQAAINAEGYDFNACMEQLRSDLCLLKNKERLQASFFIMKDILYKENH